MHKLILCLLFFAAGLPSYSQTKIDRGVREHLLMDFDWRFAFGHLLPAGKYTAEVLKDGVNADRHASDYKKQSIPVSPSDKLTVHLAPAGGWVARLNKVN